MALLKRGAREGAPSAITHHTVVTWEPGHVRTAVLRLAGGAAEILGVASAPVDDPGDTSRPDAEHWCEGCDRALAQSEDMTQRLVAHRVVPDHATMAIPSAVTRSLTVVDEIGRRNGRRPISVDELHGMIRRGYRKAQDRLDVRARGSREDIVCGSLAYVTLDGQPVSDPVGLTGEHLLLHMFFSLAPAEWIRSLELVAERLGLELTAIVPHHMALASPIMDTAALLLVVEDGQTTVDLVRRGRVEWAAVVPRGARALIDDTVADLGVPEQQLDSLLRAYRAGQLRDDVEQRMGANYWRALRAWMGMIADQVRAVSTDAHTPYRVYSHDATGQVPEITAALETPHWEQLLDCGRCPKVDTLDVQGIQSVLDSTGQASGPGFLLMRSLVNYVARLHSPGNEVDRALTNTIRWRHGA